MTHEDIQKLGASLRPIRQNGLASGDRDSIRRFWYQGDEPYFDVFFDFQGRDLVWFQFTFRGKSFTWYQNQGIETGFTNETQVMPDYYPSSKLIATHTEVDEKFMRLVRDILHTREDEYPFDRALQLFN
ncbi:hypothetical protein [Roseofilum casamattae]|uniref:Uncharacterized protein n=1 Tax=Roseofilum casamattae BLCC-M143 TaxID=3022442 RepID=A0ABT7C1F9_9CYAN|nr:hypothetical protein [Roseofilum casamattae]MDJ1185298.1 hypothetical protein [Roseofilum casamattae BLCC-M143]